MSTYRAGQKVTHETFGKGIVLNSSGSGPDEQVTIAFDGEGIKKLEVRHANLRLA
jgi:DNA helicase-2/ATP-dependent DNA helicase PcrA